VAYQRNGSQTRLRQCCRAASCARTLRVLRSGSACQRVPWVARRGWLRLVAGMGRPLGARLSRPCPPRQGRTTSGRFTSLDTAAPAQGIGTYQGDGGEVGHGQHPRILFAGKPQVSAGICKRICKRDSAGRPWTGETRQASRDRPQTIGRGQRHDGRRAETPETPVVLLITQRS
jgi:hypothetical protein